MVISTVSLSCVVCGGSVVSAGIGEEIRVCPICGKHIVRKETSEENEALMTRAFSLRLDRRFDDAAKCYSTVLAMSPDNGDAHFGVALCRHGAAFKVGTDGKIKTEIYRFRPDSFNDDISLLRSLELSGEESRKNTLLFAGAVQREKDIYSRMLDIRPYDVVICCAEKETADSHASASFEEAQRLKERFKAQGIRTVIFHDTLDRLDRSERAKFFCAFSTSKMLVNVLNTPKDKESPVISDAVEFFGRIAAGGADRQIKNIIVKDYAPQMTKAMVDEGLSVMFTPEDRTEFVLNTEDYLRKYGRHPGAKALPVIDDSKNGMRISRAFAYIKAGAFENAVDILNDIILSEPKNASALWGLYLCENNAKEVSDILRSPEKAKGTEILTRIIRSCDVETADWVEKFIETLSFNIHIRFLASFKRRDTVLSSEYAKKYSEIAPTGILNEAHRVMLSSLRGAERAMLPGALLMCLAYYRDVPFAPGTMNTATVASVFTTLRNAYFKRLAESFSKIGKSGDSVESQANAFVEKLRLYCEPSAYFTANTSCTPASVFMSVADEAVCMWFFVAQKLELSTASPNNVQTAIIDACYNKASAIMTQEYSVADLAGRRRKKKNTRAEKKQTPSQKFLSNALSVISSEEDGEDAEANKKGVWQTMWMIIMFVASLAPVAVGVMANIRPDMLLRFSRAGFVSVSTGGAGLLGLIICFFSFLIFRVRKVRKHNFFGRAVLSVTPFMSLLCSIAGIGLTVISALTFPQRMSLIGISTAQEFLYIENYPSGNFELSSDIDITGREFVTIKKFSGSFDGRGHTLSGFTSENQTVIQKNTGSLLNFVIADSNVNSFVETNHGTIKNVDVRNTSCKTALIENNNSILTDMTLSGCHMSGGAVICRNRGDISNVTLENNTVECAENGAYSLSDTRYAGSLVAINDGKVSSCTLDFCEVKNNDTLAQAGGVFGINTGTVSEVSGTNITLEGSAVTAGLYTARNTGTITGGSVSGNVKLSVTRSFGGFTGENTKMISDCTVDEEAEIALYSDVSAKSSAGGFAGRATGITENCTVNGSLVIDGKTDDKTLTYIAGGIALCEGKTTDFTTNCEVKYSSSVSASSATDAIGGVFGSLKNASAKHIFRTGNVQVTLEDGTGDSRKNQAQYYVGAFAGSMISEEEYKNETVSLISVSGDVSVTSAVSTTIMFGGLTGYSNCDNMVNQVLIASSCTVSAPTYEKINLGALIGKTDAIERIIKAVYTGRLTQTGDNPALTTFAGGPSNKCEKCFAGASCGTSDNAGLYVPEEVFTNPEFYTGTVGWTEESWRLEEGKTAELK